MTTARPATPPTAPSTTATGALRIECLTSAADVDRLAPEWQALFEQVDDALPFTTYEWTAAWWTHLRRETRWTEDALRLYTVRDASGTLVAVAPMMLTRWRVAGVPVIRLLQFIGTDPNITEVRGMLVARDREVEVVAALERTLERERGVDWLQWCGLRREAGSLEALQSIAPAVVNKEISTFMLTLPDSFDEFKKTLPRNIRESLRKCYNSIAREGHEWSLRVAETPEDVAIAVETLIDLHSKRAALDGTVPHRDCFDTPNARRFLSDVAVRFARRGMVRLFQIVVAGEVVSARLGFLFGSRLYLYYSGFDPAWGRYSVMTTAVAEALKYASANGIPSVNLSSGADESKLRWRPEPVGWADAVVVKPGARARLAFRAMQPETKAALKRILSRRRAATRA